MQLNKVKDSLVVHRGELDDINGHFTAIGTTTTMLLEVANM